MGLISNGLDYMVYNEEGVTDFSRVEFVNYQLLVMSKGLGKLREFEEKFKLASHGKYAKRYNFKYIGGEDLTVLRVESRDRTGYVDLAYEGNNLVVLHHVGDNVLLSSIRSIWSVKMYKSQLDYKGLESKAEQRIMDTFNCTREQAIQELMSIDMNSFNSLVESALDFYIKYNKKANYYKKSEDLYLLYVGGKMELLITRSFLHFTEYNVTKVSIDDTDMVAGRMKLLNALLINVKSHVSLAKAYKENNDNKDNNKGKAVEDKKENTDDCKLLVGMSGRYLQDKGKNEELNEVLNTMVDKLSSIEGCTNIEYRWFNDEDVLLGLDYHGDQHEFVITPSFDTSYKYSTFNNILFYDNRKPLYLLVNVRKVKLFLEKTRQL